MKYKGNKGITWKGVGSIFYKGANPTFPNKQN